jgi:prepilin-type processing-associated H-X9-DG protein
MGRASRSEEEQESRGAGEQEKRDWRDETSPSIVFFSPAPLLPCSPALLRLASLPEMFIIFSSIAERVSFAEPHVFPQPVRLAMNRRTRSGFTLIELLVVFALLAFAIGLLLPIIQQVRAAAERTQSQNNLKQLGIACHAHHDAFKSFPAGVDDSGFSAAARLLPFVEQNAVFQQIDFKQPARAQANDVARGSFIITFLSPMDPQSSHKGKSAPTNYLYSAGTQFSLDNNNGVFYRNSKTGIVTITDGTSNTIMIGETLIGDDGKQAQDVKRQHVALDPMELKNLNDNSGVQDFANNKNIVADRCHIWIEGKFLQGTFTGTREINDTKPDVDCGGAGGLSALRGLHKGVNVAMCDGSVRFVSDTIAFQTWQAVCTRNGGEVVNFNF